MSNGRMCLTVGMLVGLVAPCALPAPAQARVLAGCALHEVYEGTPLFDMLFRPHAR